MRSRVRGSWNERGVALPLALLALLLLSGFLLAFLSLGAMEPQISANLSDMARARYLAEAGIEWGYDQLVAASGQAGSWDPVLSTNGGVMATNMALPGLTAASGTFSVTVRNDNQANDSQITGEAVDGGGNTTDLNGVVIVTATGTVNTVSRQVQVVARRLGLPQFQAAMSIPGLQADTYFNTSSFDVDGRDYVCTASCDDPANWGLNSDQASMKYGVQVLPGIQQNTGLTYEQMVESALNTPAKQNNVKGKDQTNPGGPFTTGFNTVAPDNQVNPTVMADFLTRLARSSATTVLQSTRACPMVLTGGGQPTNTPTLTNGCGLDQTLDLGTLSNPKLVYVKGELDPSSMFTALRMERAIKGAGILVVEDGDLRINGNNLRWDGLILVVGRYVETGFRGSGAEIYGGFAAMEQIWNEPRGFFEVLVQGAGATIRFSQQNLSMVQRMRSLHSLTSWREL